jgi:hypothetical protein
LWRRKTPVPNDEYPVLLVRPFVPHPKYRSYLKAYRKKEGGESEELEADYACMKFLAS